jgi:hypothetical protein
MILFDIVQPIPHGEISKLSESELSTRVEKLCAHMNWAYDIDALNERVFDQGVTDMKRIEEHLTVLFAKNKEAAMRLWETNCPFAIPGITPAFALS